MKKKPRVRLWKLHSQNKKYENERYVSIINAWSIEAAIKKAKKDLDKFTYIYEVELIATEDKS